MGLAVQCLGVVGRHQSAPCPLWSLAARLVQRGGAALHIILLTQHCEATGLAKTWRSTCTLGLWISMTCQRFWQKQHWYIYIYIFYNLKENSLILQSAVLVSEYLVSVVDILMSEVSRVAQLKIYNIRRIFSRAGLLWWMAILSLTRSFILPNTFLSWDMSIALKCGSRTLMYSYFPVWSLAAEVIAALACSESVMFWLHK